MSDHIYYEYHTIDAALSDIQQQINAADGVKDDLKTIFTNLTRAYEGQAAEALHAQSVQVDNMMGEVLQDLTASQKEAQNQKEMMHQMDQANARQF